MGQRQDAGDYPVAFCDQVIRAVTERLLDDTLPSRQMKEGSAGMSEDKIIPPPLIAAAELPYCDAGLRSIQARVEQLSGPMCCQVIDIIGAGERDHQFVVPRTIRFLALSG